MNKGHSTIESFIKYTITTIVVVALAIGFIKLLSYGADNIDKQYCNGLKAQAEQYRNFSWSEDNTGGFYITKLDKEQCDHFGIKINAPVR
jgi:hypothetical protein